MYSWLTEFYAKMGFLTCVIFVLILSPVILGSQCVLSDGKCAYNVYLSNGNDCGRPLQKGAAIQNEQRDDYTAADIQRDFNVVKTDHEDRIRELEASVQKMLRSSIPTNQMSASSGPRDGLLGPVNVESLFPGVNATERGLLSSLHNHFTKLRNDIQSQTRKLLDMQVRLNDTTNALSQAHDELFKNSEKVIAAEHKVTSMVQERYILKNQIKFKSEQLHQALEKVNFTDAKLLQVEKQLYVLVRSESNLKEELGLYQWKFNNSLKAIKSLKNNHTRLERKLNKTQAELDRANIDLMECITGEYYRFHVIGSVTWSLLTLDHGIECFIPDEPSPHFTRDINLIIEIHTIDGTKYSKTCN